MDVSLSPRARLVVIWVAIIVALLVLLQVAHAIRPFIWAIITAYIFYPLVSFIHRKTHLPKHLITIWLFITIGLIFAILAINLTPRVVNQLQGLQDEIPNAIDRAQIWIENHESARLRQLDLDTGFLQDRISEAGQAIAKRLSARAVPLLLSTFTFLIDALVFLISTFYFIVYGDRFVFGVRQLLHRRYHREFDRLLNEINSTLSAYIRGQAILVVIMAVASFIALTVLQVNFALTIAIATGFLELIPLVGPWSAGGLAVIVSLFQDTTPFGWSHATLAIVIGVIYFSLRELEDNVVIPLLIGRIVHLHPLLVIFAIIVGTSLGGVLGLILAVPVAAVIKILATYFYAKITAREIRHIETIHRQHELDRLIDDFPDLMNNTVVLLIEPDTLSWDDLPLMRRAIDSARDNAIALSVVTTDSIAGALATAVGIDTTTLLPGTPAPFDAMPR